MAIGAGLAGQACAQGSPSPGSNAADLGGGGSGGAACDIGTLALANVGGSACAKNSLGGSAFDSSCTGNGGEPEYWCADFVRWAWAASGADVGGLTAAAGSFYTYGQKHGTLSDTPAVGDAVVYNYAGGGVADHVAIVTQVNGDGTIETASGDWDGESGSEAHFSSTSHVVLNSPAYPGTVGTSPAIMGMTISAFIAPAGVTACSGTAGGSGGGGSGTAGAGGAAGAGGKGGAAGGGGLGGGTAGKGGAGGGAAGGAGHGGSTGHGGGSAGGVGHGGGSGGGAAGGAGHGGGTGGHGGGTGGTGGSAGTSGYAFFETRDSEHHRALDLAVGASETIRFAWHDAAGPAAPADLWIEADGRPILQVAAVGEHPFVRAGLDVSPIIAGATYRIQVTRDVASIVVELLAPSGRAVLRTQVWGPASADVVLPGPAWRSAVTADGTE